MDRGKKDSPQRTQRGAEVCCFSLRSSADSAVIQIVQKIIKSLLFEVDTSIVLNCTCGVFFRAHTENVRLKFIHNKKLCGDISIKPNHN